METNIPLLNPNGAKSKLDLSNWKKSLRCCYKWIISAFFAKSMWHGLYYYTQYFPFEDASTKGLNSLRRIYPRDRFHHIHCNWNIRPSRPFDSNELKSVRIRFEWSGFFPSIISHQKWRYVKHKQTVKNKIRWVFLRRIARVELAICQISKNSQNER